MIFIAHDDTDQLSKTCANARLFDLEELAKTMLAIRYKSVLKVAMFQWDPLQQGQAHRNFDVLYRTSEVSHVCSKGLQLQYSFCLVLEIQDHIHVQSKKGCSGFEPES